MKNNSPALLELTGLTDEEVLHHKNAGLTNQIVDSVSPSYLRIIIRNIFNLINIFVFPLLAVMLIIGLYKEVLIFSTFAIVNSLVAMADEIRIKRRLDKIKIDYSQKLTVIRNRETVTISASDLVKDDIVIVREGESIPTDGIIRHSEYLQVDESLLTGESNYVSLDAGESVKGGSFVVTGECIYQVEQVGNQNYINVLGKESKTFHKRKSRLQANGDQLTIFFVISAVLFGGLSFYSAYNQNPDFMTSLLPLLTGVALIIPQTLIFLFTFSFSIAVLKLSRRGVLVQRGSAIETIAHLDVLCLDKTGTITSNDMNVVGVAYKNLDEKIVESLFLSLGDHAFGRNKTLVAILDHFSKSKANKLTQVEQMPFTSKLKMAKAAFNLGENHYVASYGAASSILSLVSDESKKFIQEEVKKAESAGLRVIVGSVHISDQHLEISEKKESPHVFLITLKESYNPGIDQTLEKIQQLGTKIKIISGDSLISVQRILNGIGLNDMKLVDLSQHTGSVSEAAVEYDVFVRAKPEDKLTIIRTLQQNKKIVGMIGDGVNDVLALKLADLSIAMEGGSKIARDVSDVILLGNNFSEFPQILSEGQNIISNLMFMNKLFLGKTFHAILFIIACALAGVMLPLKPTSILIFSFFGTSLPSYVVAFARRTVKPGKNFFEEVLPPAIWWAIASAVATIVLYAHYFQTGEETVNTILIYAILFSNIGLFGYLLWRGKFITRLSLLIVAMVATGVAGVIPSLIQFGRDYYEIVQLDNAQWLNAGLAGVLTTIICALLTEATYRLRKANDE